MVGLDGVDDLFLLAVLAGHLHADVHVAALHFVGDGLTDVMQQAGALGQVDLLSRQPQLGGQQAGDVGNLDRVGQHVLAVAGAVTHPAQQLDELLVDAVDAGLEDGAFALLLDDGLHLPLGLFHRLLDAGGVDAAVGDKLFQGQAGNLPADGVKAGQGDGFGRVIDDQVHAGERLQRADITALAADDAALHFVIGQGHHRNGGLAGVVGGAPLDGGGDDLAGAAVGFVLQLALDLLQLGHGIVLGLGLHLGDQLGLGFLHRQAGDLLQHFKLAVFQRFQLGLLLVQGLQLLAELFLLGFDAFGLALQSFFLLLDAALLLLDFGPALLAFPLVFTAGAENFFAGFHHGFPLFGFCGFDGFVDDAFCFILGTADLFFSNFFTIKISCENACG